MFLRYAKPDDKSGNNHRQKPQPAQGDQCRDSSGRKNYQRYSSMSALPDMIGRGGRRGRDDFECSSPTRTSASSTTNQSGESTLGCNNRSKPPVSRAIDPYLEKSIRGFEQGCIGGLKLKHGLRHSHALSAAKAFRNAAEMATSAGGSGAPSQESLVEQFAVYQSAVDSAMNVKTGYNNSNKDEVLSQRPSGTEDHHLTHPHQQDEIYYLRLAVKNLVLQLAKTTATPSGGSTKKDTEEKETESIEPGETHQNGVPTRIELHSTCGVSDATDELSPPSHSRGSLVDSPSPTITARQQMQRGHSVPCLLQNVSTPIASTAATTTSTTAAAREKMECSLPFLPPLSYHTSSPLPLEYTNADKESMSPITPTHYSMQAMAQLFLSYQSGNAIPDTPPIPSGIQVLEEGEAVNDRTRGMKVQLNLRGNLFQGRYNGSLDNGAPHGQGVLRFDNRDLYVGTFDHGFMQGEGTLFCRSSGDKKLAVLRGKFVKNEFTGVMRCRSRSSSSSVAD